MIPAASTCCWVLKHGVGAGGRCRCCPRRHQSPRTSCRTPSLLQVWIFLVSACGIKYTLLGSEARGGFWMPLPVFARRQNTSILCRPCLYLHDFLQVRTPHAFCHCPRWHPYVVGRMRQLLEHLRRQLSASNAESIGMRVHALKTPCVPGDAGGELSVADLMAGLGPERAKLGAARKALERLGRRAAPVAAPLPDRIAARKLRQAGCGLEYRVWVGCAGWVWHRASGVWDSCARCSLGLWGNGLAAPGWVRLCCHRCHRYGGCNVLTCWVSVGCAVQSLWCGILTWAWLNLAIGGTCRSQAAVGWVRSGSITCLLTCLFAYSHLEQVWRWSSRPTPACACGTTRTHWRATHLVVSLCWSACSWAVLSYKVQSAHAQVQRCEHSKGAVRKWQTS